MYAFRWSYYDFYTRYRVLCHSREIDRADYCRTAQVIVAKIVENDENYRFGKTKLFFRAGQVAYMERRRGERLRGCGIMMQKHVRGFLRRVAYRRMRKSTLVLQKFTRGFLARRRAKRIRQTRAAIIIQKHVRGWLRRVHYLTLRRLTIAFQARARGALARRRFGDRLRIRSATLIQSRVRGWLARRRYAAEVRKVVLAQGVIRCYLARKQLKRLRIRAKSVEHQKSLNKGLENKIIELQQQLTEVRRTAKADVALKEQNGKMALELEDLRNARLEAEVAKKEVAQQTDRIESLIAELNQEKAARTSLEGAWTNELRELRERVAGLQNDKETLQSALELEKDKVSSMVTVEEAKRQVGQERTTAHAEFEQERIAYQDLLREVSRKEAQIDNLQEEIAHLKKELRAGNVSFVDGNEYHLPLKEIIS